MENLSLEERVLYNNLCPSILDVNMLNKKIESIFRKPQDIEFLFNSDKFYCLQSRDITTL